MTTANTSINPDKMRELQLKAERAAKEGKILSFPQPKEPSPEVKAYFEGILADNDRDLRLSEGLPAVMPTDPADRERFLADAAAARRRRIEKQFGPMVIPAAFQNLTPWTLVERYGDGVKTNKVAAIKAAAAWAGVDLKTGKVSEPTAKRPGLFLYGDPGTGKSALAWWAVHQLGWGLWLTWNDLLGKVQNEWSGREAIIEAAQTAPVLFLDDLGDPYTANGQVTDDRRTILFRIINHRLAHRLPTIITSNINGGNLDVVLVNLERQFDKRIVDRLFELCNFVEMGGANLRRTSQKGA